MKPFFEKLITIDASTFYETLKDTLRKEEGMFIVTANPETFTIGHKDKSFRQLLEDQATTIVPDGIGIVKVANMIGYPVKERIPGIEVAEHLLEYANLYDKKIALLGAKPNVIENIKKIIAQRYPNIQIVKAMDGYCEDKDQAMDEIAQLQPDVVLVALGIPMQEKLLYAHLHQFKNSVLVGVGGSFDVMSGTKKRAPKLFIKLNLEWLYRIMKEPSRLKRFYNNNIKFIRNSRKYGK